MDCCCKNDGIAPTPTELLADAVSTVDAGSVAVEAAELRIESICNIARNLMAHFSETDADVIRRRMDGRTLAGVGKVMRRRALWVKQHFYKARQAMGKESSQGHCMA